MNVLKNNNVNFTSSDQSAGAVGRKLGSWYTRIPNITVSNQDKLNKMQKLAKYIATPTGNRLIIGAAAIVSQPLIDYNNHMVDKETRKVSALRTTAKIIAGTSVGIVVRETCYRLSKNPKLLPTNTVLNKTQLGNYQIAVSTIMALGAMLFTNFLIDAPLTTFLTNKFKDIADKREAKKS